MLSADRTASQFSLLPNAAFDPFNLDTDYIAPSSHIINMTAIINRWSSVTLQLANRVETTFIIIGIMSNFK